VLSARWLFRRTQQSRSPQPLRNVLPVAKNLDSSILPIARRVKLLKFGHQLITDFRVGNALDESRNEINFHLWISHVEWLEDLVSVIVVGLDVVRALGESGKAWGRRCCERLLDWSFGKSSCSPVSAAGYGAPRDSGFRTRTGGLVTLTVWLVVRIGYFLI
jgi:hypothetical protein